MRKIPKRDLIFAVIVLILIVCIHQQAKTNASQDNQDAPTRQSESFDYINRKGENFAYTISSDNGCQVYEKLPSELIDEWQSNVALAEKTYMQSDVYILTEGFIGSINKNEFDDGSYYIKLQTNSYDQNILGTDSIEIYFHHELEYRALLNYRTGDYITLVCSASDTTSFYEYPRLEAESVLTPISSDKTQNSAAPVESLGDLSQFYGLTVGDLIAQCGEHYQMGYSEGPYISYPDLSPFLFFYDSSENAQFDAPS